MTIWIDAQLSPALARWLYQHFNLVALSVQELGFRSAVDPEIFAGRMGRTTTLVELEPDVAAVFDTSESVNSALRALVAIPVPKKRKKAS